jgi:hypothetical protein
MLTSSDFQVTIDETRRPEAPSLSIGMRRKILTAFTIMSAAPSKEQHYQRQIGVV